MLQPCINRQSSHPSRSTSCRPGCRYGQREVEFRRVRASRGRVALSMAHCHSGKHATPSPSRRINMTKPQSPRSDVPHTFAVKQSQHRMCLGIAPTRFHFRVFQRAARTHKRSSTVHGHADVDREAAQWRHGGLAARFGRRRPVVRVLVWPRTAKSSRPGPLLREKSEAGLRHESGGRRPRSAARRMPCCPSARYPMGASWPAVTDNGSSSGAGYRHPRVCRNARLGRLKYRPPRLKSSSWEMDVRSCCWRRRRHPGRCV